MKEVLIVLGSPNTTSGELSSISTSRLDCCLDLFKKESLVLCTGGWGPHFNTTEHSHAHYAKAYLTQKGLPESAFLEFALSKNTVDDAVKAKNILSKLEDNLSLTIITSGYHLERVKMIFNEVLKGYTMMFIGVPCKLDEDEYAILLAHEKKAITSILQKGLYY
ncbi:YdcF family protein [Flagellimonas sp. S3867]|uniref:YdcF family protein n=1 Tax=Flagellimonas sp. S3867 TaxID=2768063 RepID=UPI001682B6FE|nr:YdcF family protein [Flagellimonas sp. S3867]